MQLLHTKYIISALVKVLFIRDFNFIIAKKILIILVHSLVDMFKKGYLTRFYEKGYLKTLRLVFKRSRFCLVQLIPS